MNFRGEHPSVAALALYAGGELPFYRRMAVRLHVRSCTACRAEAALYQRDSFEIAAGALELPPGVKFDRLAAEMRANIRLGMEASEIIAPFHLHSDPPVPAWSWKPALALATLCIALMSGWWWLANKRAAEQVALRAPEPALLQASERGVAWKEGNLTWELKTPKAQPAFLSVSTEGTASSRSVDTETMQVTVNHVYME